MAAPPYEGMDPVEALQAVMCGYRLPRPAVCSDGLYQLMQACWALEPQSRPSFTMLHAVLSDLLPKPRADGTDGDYDNTDKKKVQLTSPEEISGYVHEATVVSVTTEADTEAPHYDLATSEMMLQQSQQQDGAAAAFDYQNAEAIKALFAEVEERERQSRAGALA